MALFFVTGCFHVISDLNPPKSVCPHDQRWQQIPQLRSLTHTFPFNQPPYLWLSFSFLFLRHTHTHTPVSPVAPVWSVTFLPSEAPLWSRRARGERDQFNPPSITSSLSLHFLSPCISLSLFLVPADLFVPLVFTSSSPSVWLSVHPDSVRPLFFLSHLYLSLLLLSLSFFSLSWLLFSFSPGTLIGTTLSPLSSPVFLWKPQSAQQETGECARPPCTDKVQTTVLVSSLF